MLFKLLCPRGLLSAPLSILTNKLTILLEFKANSFPTSMYYMRPRATPGALGETGSKFSLKYISKREEKAKEFWGRLCSSTALRKRETVKFLCRCGEIASITWCSVMDSLLTEPVGSSEKMTHKWWESWKEWLAKNKLTQLNKYRLAQQWLGVLKTTWRQFESRKGNSWRVWIREGQSSLLQSAVMRREREGSKGSKAKAQESPAMWCIDAPWTVQLSRKTCPRLVEIKFQSTNAETALISRTGALEGKMLWSQSRSQAPGQVFWVLSCKEAPRERRQQPLWTQAVSLYKGVGISRGLCTQGGTAALWGRAHGDTEDKDLQQRTLERVPLCFHEPGLWGAESKQREATSLQVQLSASPLSFLLHTYFQSQSKLKLVQHLLIAWYPTELSQNQGLIRDPSKGVCVWSTATPVKFLQAAFITLLESTMLP